MFLITPSFSQNKELKLNTKKFTKQEKDSLDIVEDIFNEGFYLSALPIYESLYDRYPEELYIAYRIGICYLNINGEYSSSIPYLEAVHKEEPNAADIKFFLGKAYLLDYRFDKSITIFNEYIQQNISDQQKEKAQHYIRNCEVGKELVADSIEVEITNVGPPINTSASEYVPVITSDESKMIFTYRGEKSMGGRQNNQVQPDPFGVYFEDVYQSHKEHGAWTEPAPLGNNINGYGHDASIALAGDGQKLFIYKQTTSDMGDIYLSELQGDIWSRPKRIEGDVNTGSWEGSASLSSSGKELYFSSTRSGGKGGRDLYIAYLQDDGSWGEVENLGPEINTEFDEDAPFIHPDGTYLFFSSKGHNSMGEYDIFYSRLKDGSWTKPKNFGYPVNTTGNDIYYVLTADGKKGYYASGREGGYGRQDIYIVEPGMFEDAALVLVKGTVTLDDQPVQADVVVSYADNGENHGEFKSNSKTGKYLINLPAKRDYNVTFTTVGQDPVEKTVAAADVDTFLERTFHIKFYTEKEDEIVAENKEEEKEATDVPENLDDYTYGQILDEYGKAEAEDLVFRVQIAAYRNPKNYTYDHLKDLGIVISADYGDDITRFTIGPNFNKLKKAEKFREKVVKNGQKDAFVIAIYKGKRTYLKELIKKGVLTR